MIVVASFTVTPLSVDAVASASPAASMATSESALNVHMINGAPYGVNAPIHVLPSMGRSIRSRSTSRTTKSLEAWRLRAPCAEAPSVASRR